MASLMYRPFMQTMLAPGNAANGHGGLTLDLLGGGDLSGSGEDTGTSVLGALLVDDVGGYTFSADHAWVSDLGTNVVANGGGSGTGAEEGELQNMQLRNSNSGVALDADDLTMTGVGDGVESVNAIVIAVLVSDSGDENPLVCHIDTGTGFDFVPNASTVTITWAGADDYIFSIGA